MKHLINMLFCLLPVFGIGQMSAREYKILEGLTGYRNELFTRNPEDRQMLGATVQRMESSGLTQEELTRLDLAMHIVFQETMDTSKASYKRARDRLNKSPVFDQLTPGEIGAIVRNRDLYDAMRIGVIRAHYPFAVNTDADVYDELLFYGVQSGERIAEIGAGTGEFAIILAVIYDSLSLFVNEIDAEKLSAIREKITTITSIKASTEVSIVEGVPDDPKLPIQDFDKIILRNSLHHFTEQSAMLARIRDVLQSGGELLIFERVVKGRYGTCPQAMTKRAIVKAISRGGFALQESKHDGNKYYFRFLKN